MDTVLHHVVGRMGLMSIDDEDIEVREPFWEILCRILDVVVAGGRLSWVLAFLEEEIPSGTPLPEPLATNVAAMKAATSIEEFMSACPAGMRDFKCPYCGYYYDGCECEQYDVY